MTGLTGYNSYRLALWLKQFFSKLLCHAHANLWWLVIWFHLFIFKTLGKNMLCDLIWLLCLFMWSCEFIWSFFFIYFGYTCINIQVRVIYQWWPSAWHIYIRADSRFAPSQWDTALWLLCNSISYWLGTNLKSALYVQDGDFKSWHSCPSVPHPMSAL